MLIFYGIRETHVKTGPLSMGGCPDCHKRGTLNAVVFARYAHVFWIPLLPLGKRILIHCDYCRAAMKPKALPDSLKIDIDRIKSEAKRPWWQYVVPVLFLLSFGSSFITAMIAGAMA